MRRLDLASLKRPETRIFKWFGYKRLNTLCQKLSERYMIKFNLL